MLITTENIKPIYPTQTYILQLNGTRKHCLYLYQLNSMALQIYLARCYYVSISCRYVMTNSAVIPTSIKGREKGHEFKAAQLTNALSVSQLRLGKHSTFNCLHMSPK